MEKIPTSRTGSPEAKNSDRLSRLIKQDALKQKEAKPLVSLSELEAAVKAKLGGTEVKTSHEKKMSWADMKAMEDARTIINFRDSEEKPLPQRRSGSELSSRSKKAANELFGRKQEKGN